ncbi:MAG: response regulator [Candidatus Rokubacteria bacterium]|nr:response regulator [Candidatus Rokubacteria bacterium]
MRRDERYLTTGQVAEALQVSPVSVKKWIKQGKLRAARTPGGHFRIAAEDLRALQESHDFWARGGPMRVLVVDDDAGVLRFLQTVLTSALPDAVVETAQDGYSALLKVGAFQPELLILDLRMPLVDGFQVCQRLKGDPSTKHIRILAITGYAEADMRNRALACGADAFLAKPMRPDVLQATLAMLLADKTA